MTRTGGFGNLVSHDTYAKHTSYVYDDNHDYAWVSVMEGNACVYRGVLMIYARFLPWQKVARTKRETDFKPYFATVSHSCATREPLKAGIIVTPPS